MAKQFDWQNSNDPRDVIHMAVQAVAEGHIVAVPGDCSYLLVGSGFHQETIERLAGLSRQESNGHGLTLMVRSSAELLDYFPTVSNSILRFASKIWPGPVAIELADSHPNSLLRCLEPNVVKNLVQANDKIRLSQPYHPVFQQMSRLLVGPLVAAPALGGENRLARTVDAIQSDLHSIVISDGETSECGLPTLVAFDENLATISREGIVAQDYLKGLSRITFLFVCTGNTCRSPMAQALMNKKIQERFGSRFPNGEIPITAYSAGVAAYGGDPASPGACQAIQAYGTNLDQHGSCQLSLEMVEQADVILTMGSRHRQAIASQWPSVASKVHMISPDGSEIIDPFGGPLEAYERCVSQLDQHTDYWIEQINLSEIIQWNDPPKSEGSA